VCKDWLNVEKSQVFLVGCHSRVLALMISRNGTHKTVFATEECSVCGDVVSAEGTSDGITVSSLEGEIINFCFE
jgi:hypothetical protein